MKNNLFKVLTLIVLKTRYNAPVARVGRIEMGLYAIGAATLAALGSGRRRERGQSRGGMMASMRCGPGSFGWRTNSQRARSHTQWPSA